jgi:hypothetical protein
MITVRGAALGWLLWTSSQCYGDFLNTRCVGDREAVCVAVCEMDDESVGRVIRYPSGGDLKNSRTKLGSVRPYLRKADSFVHADVG